LFQTVNIVTVRSGWILQKIAERIAAAGNDMMDCTQWKVSHNPVVYADINFYCDVQNCWRGNVPGPSRNIGLFTHVHANDPKTVDRTALKLDYIFHMAPRYMTMFSNELKYPQSRMNLMVPFQSTWDVKKPTIGIFQRGKYEGKGFHFMLDFTEKHARTCKLFDWIFVGNDWEDVVQKLGEIGATATTYSDGRVDYPDGYENLYNQVDYVLIPSKWEGGTIACLEAASKGCHIIAADVGWCRTWADEIFPVGDLDALGAILWSKVSHNLTRAIRLKTIISYKRCAEQIIDAASHGRLEN